MNDSTDAEADRSFFRDVPKLPDIDVGGVIGACQPMHRRPTFAR